MPAEKAGIRAGDVIVAIDGKSISTFQDLQAIVGTSAGRPLAVVVRRDGADVDLTATPEGRPVQGGAPGEVRGTLGVVGTLQPESVPRAFWLGIQQTGQVIGQTFAFLGDVVSGKGDAKDIGGPIKIAQISKEVADSGGMGGLITLTAFISISIGLLNLFPVPLLDGGHLMFYAVEAIRGRPLRRAHAGDGLPGRLRPGDDADDLRHLERYRQSVPGLIWRPSAPAGRPWPRGNAVPKKGKGSGGCGCARGETL